MSVRSTKPGSLTWLGYRLIPFLRRPADRLFSGPVRRIPLSDVVFQDRCGPSSPDIVAPAKRRTSHDCRCAESRKERFWSQAHRESGSVGTTALQGGLIIPTE